MEDKNLPFCECYALEPRVAEDKTNRELNNIFSLLRCLPSFLSVMWLSTRKSIIQLSLNTWQPSRQKWSFGVSLSDSDWLHQSAESMLTITNSVTVLSFRQELSAKEKELYLPWSATSYSPMVWLAAGMTRLAAVTAIVPAVTNADVHTPYFGGFMDLPNGFTCGDHWQIQITPLHFLVELKWI